MLKINKFGEVLQDRLGPRSSGWELWCRAIVLFKERLYSQWFPTTVLGTKSAPQRYWSAQILNIVCKNQIALQAFYCQVHPNLKKVVKSFENLNLLDLELKCNIN